MAKLDYRPALELLEGARSAVVCGHVNPDGDSLGSVLALTAALRGQGLEVTPLLATRECPRLYDFLEGYDTLVPACDYHGKPDVFISVDVPLIARTGDAVAVFERAGKSIAIDHHPGRAEFADASFVDDTAAAAGMLVWDFIEQAGWPITPAIATCCYTALVTDTGRFQYQKVGGRVFRAAAAMAEAGAVPADIATRVYQRRSIAALKLEALAVERMEFPCDGRVVVSWVREQDFAGLHAVKEDGESLIDRIRELDGVEVAVMLREQGAVIRGSIRSKTAFDVSAIARQMNGGGHAAAAGFTLKCGLDQARKTVVGLLEAAFAQETAQGSPVR